MAAAPRGRRTTFPVAQRCPEHGAGPAGRCRARRPHCASRSAGTAAAAGGRCGPRRCGRLGGDRRGVGRPCPAHSPGSGAAPAGFPGRCEAVVAASAAGGGAAPRRLGAVWPGPVRLWRGAGQAQLPLCAPHGLAPVMRSPRRGLGAYLWWGCLFGFNIRAYENSKLGIQVPPLYGVEKN